MTEYTAPSGVKVQTCRPVVFDNIASALWGEYTRWIRRARGKDKPCGS